MLPDNLILIETTDRESCSRKDYEEAIASPIMGYFHRQGERLTLPE